MFPPAAGMAISAILLAWPAQALAQPVHVNMSPALTSSQAALDTAIAHERVTDHAQRVQARRLRVLLAREEAARDRREEAARDRREARLAALRAVSAAARRAHAPRPAPQAAPAAIPPPQAGTYSYAQLEALWVGAGGPASVEAAAATIAECESGGNPRAYNPSGASGLWQILGVPFPGDPFNGPVNARMAVAKYRAAGDSFSPWVCQA